MLKLEKEAGVKNSSTRHWYLCFQIHSLGNIARCLTLLWQQSLPLVSHNSSWWLFSFYKHSAFKSGEEEQIQDLSQELNLLPPLSWQRDCHNLLGGWCETCSATKVTLLLLTQGTGPSETGSCGTGERIPSLALPANPAGCPEKLPPSLKASKNALQWFEWIWQLAEEE